MVTYELVQRDEGMLRYEYWPKAIRARSRASSPLT